MKYTPIMQFPPDTTDVPQLFVATKSVPADMLEMFSVAVPLFERVTVWPSLVVPMSWEPKTRLLTESLVEGVGVGVPPPPLPPHAN